MKNKKIATQSNRKKKKLKYISQVKIFTKL